MDFLLLHRGLEHDTLNKWETTVETDLILETKQTECSVWSRSFPAHLNNYPVKKGRDGDKMRVAEIETDYILIMGACHIWGKLSNDHQSMSTGTNPTL